MLFAEALADHENDFAISLEQLGLKKSANNEVFDYIKNTVEMEVDNEIFKQNKVHGQCKNSWVASKASVS